MVYYYKDIRKSLSAFEHVRIIVSGLGCFNVKHWKVNYRLIDLRRMWKVYQQYTTRRSEPIKKDIKEKLDQLEHMSAVCEKEKIKKQKIKDKNRELEKEYKDRLAKQMENSGGNLEHMVSESENKSNSE